MPNHQTDAEFMEKVKKDNNLAFYSSVTENVPEYGRLCILPTDFVEFPRRRELEVTVPSNRSKKYKEFGAPEEIRQVRDPEVVMAPAFVWEVPLGCTGSRTPAGIQRTMDVVARFVDSPECDDDKFKVVNELKEVRRGNVQSEELRDPEQIDGRTRTVCAVPQEHSHIA